MGWNERIIIDLSIRHGKPMVRWTRVPVHRIEALQVKQPRKKSVRNMVLSTRIYGPLLSTRKDS